MPMGSQPSIGLTPFPIVCVLLLALFFSHLGRSDCLLTVIAIVLGTPVWEADSIAFRHPWFGLVVWMDGVCSMFDCAAFAA